MTVLLKNVSNLLGTLVLLVSTVAYAETKSLPELDAKFETVQHHVKKPLSAIGG